MSMDNAQYLEQLNPALDDQEKRECLAIMDKYGENRWWLSEDLRTIAYYQLRENRLLVDWTRFCEGVRALLGRPVYTHEYGLCREELLKESEEAWQGIEHSAEEKRTAIDLGIDRLAEVAGDRLIVCEFPGATRYRDFRGRELFVSDGISSGKTWMTCYCVPGSGGTHRLKSPSLPLRSTREEAQRDLDQYAARKGFKPIREGQA
jgi:hypothetical protein